MADLEKLRRRAPNNRVFQHFLALGQISRAKTFLACDMIVSFGTSGTLLGLMGALIFAVGGALDLFSSDMAKTLLVFGIVNMVAADAAGYAVWRMMRAEPTLAGDTRPDFGPMLWILIKESMRFARWNLRGMLAGQYGRCTAQLSFNKRGEIGVNFTFTLAPGETGVTSRGALGRWERLDDSSFALRFGASTLTLQRTASGAWRFAAGPARDTLATAWSAPLDELTLKADRDF
jgi:hypothetical protein